MFGLEGATIETSFFPLIEIVLVLQVLVFAVLCTLRKTPLYANAGEYAPDPMRQAS